MVAYTVITMFLSFCCVQRPARPAWPRCRWWWSDWLRSRAGAPRSPGGRSPRPGTIQSYHISPPARQGSHRMQAETSPELGFLLILPCAGGFVLERNIETLIGQRAGWTKPLSLKVVTSAWPGLNLRRRARQSTVLFFTAR